MARASSAGLYRDGFRSVGHHGADRLDRVGLSAMVGLTLGAMIALGSLRVIGGRFAIFCGRRADRSKIVHGALFRKLPILTAVLEVPVWVVMSALPTSSPWLAAW